MANKTDDIYTPYAFESLAVSTVSVSLSESVYGAGAYEPVMARLSPATDGVYYRLDGAPATSDAHVLAVNTTIDVYGAAAIRQLRLIRVTGDATVSVTYFRREN